jgi:hypothetical protein
MAVFFENCSETSDSIKGGKFRHWLSNSLLFLKDVSLCSVSWCQRSRPGSADWPLSFRLCD